MHEWYDRHCPFDNVMKTANMYRPMALTGKDVLTALAIDEGYESNMRLSTVDRTMNADIAHTPVKQSDIFETIASIRDEYARNGYDDLPGSVGDNIRAKIDGIISALNNLIPFADEL
jgi:hypothetical protein